LRVFEKKTVLKFNVLERRQMVDSVVDSPSKKRQCELLSIRRSGLYYIPKQSPQREVDIMNLIDKIHLDHPYYGVRRLRVELHKCGFAVGRKLISKLLLKMNLRIQYPPKRTSIPDLGHKIYPYLLRNLTIDRANQVWQIDITYIRMERGFMYLMGIIDVHSRYVLHWSVSNTMDKRWCCEVLKDAIAMYGVPEICNTDQGSQFTSSDFTDILKNNGVKISMCGKGRAKDNAYIERLWRSVKQENIYLNVYETGTDLYAGLDQYFAFYNSQRPHQSLNYKTPQHIYKQVA
jgi:putative transposase